MALLSNAVSYSNRVLHQPGEIKVYYFGHSGHLEAGGAVYIVAWWISVKGWRGT